MHFVEIFEPDSCDSTGILYKRGDYRKIENGVDATLD